MCSGRFLIFPFPEVAWRTPKTIILFRTIFIVYNWRSCSAASVPDLGQSSHCSTSSTLVDIDISAVNVFLWSSLLTGAGLGVPKWIGSFGFKSNIEEVFRKDSFMTFFRELNSGLWCFLTMTSVQFRKQSVIFVILFTRWIILITFISFYFIFIFYFILSWVHLYSKYMKKF